MEREDELPEPEGDEQEEEETTDPLAELPEDPEERKAALATYLEAERERIRAEEKQAQEQVFQGHKAAYEAAEKRRLRDRFGIEVGDNDDLTVADPQRALSLLQGAPKQAEQPDPQPDPVYQPAEFAAWNQRQITKAAGELLAPVMARLDALQTAALQPQVTAAEGQARESLERVGLGHYAEHPEFGREFRAALNQFPLEARHDPRAITMAARSVTALLEDDRLPQPKAREEEPVRDERTGRFATVQDVSRAGLGQATRSRGGGRPSSERYSPEFRAEAESADMTPEEYEAYGNADADPYKYADAKFAKQGRR